MVFSDLSGFFFQVFAILAWCQNNLDWCQLSQKNMESFDENSAYKTQNGQSQSE